MNQAKTCFSSVLLVMACVATAGPPRLITRASGSSARFAILAGHGRLHGLANAGYGIQRPGPLGQEVDHHPDDEQASDSISVCNHCCPLDSLPRDDRRIHARTK